MSLPVDNKIEVPSTDDNVGVKVDPDEESLSTVDSGISMKSGKSMDSPIQFSGGSEGKSSHSQHTTEPGDVLCAVCPKRALKSCLTCMASYCELHVRPHYTAPALQRHKLVDATEDLEQKLCTRHNRELELYCRTDQTPICVLCMAVEHNGHDITELGEHQQMLKNKSEMEMKTAVPPPGPIEFSSVMPDSVCVCWGPPEGLPGPHRFRVTWTGEGNKGQLEVQDLKLHVQQLSPGEKYTFTVATLRDDGRQSPCVSETVRTDIPPPECLTLGMDPTSVSVTWTKPAGVGQASYLLTLCCDGKCLQTTSTKSLQHRFSELETEREYTVSVATVLKEGQSKPISEDIRTSIPVPGSLTVGSVTPTSADLSWRLQVGIEKIPYSFLISYHSEGAEPQTISTESCSTTLTDLQPDTQYTVTVCCGLRDGGRSRDTSAIIQTTVPAPGPIEFTSVTPDSVCLRWGPPEGLIGPHTFRVTWTGDSRQGQDEVQDLKLHVQQLTPGEKYTFTVATLSDDGRQSTSVTATVCTDIPPPESLAVSVDSTSVSVTWSKPDSVDQASYSLTLSGDGDPQTFSTRSLQHHFSGLDIGRKYSVSLSTVVSGSQSRAISKTIRTSILVPGSLTVGSVTPTSAVISWSLHQGMEQVPHSFLISYHSEGTEPKTFSTEFCSTTLTGLQPDTQYTASVCCQLRDGGRSQDTIISIQTGLFVPERLNVDALDVESGDPESGVRWRARLSWSLRQEMEQIPHSFLISYHSEGAEPQTISTESCSTTLIDLKPGTQYTVTACTVLQGGKRSKSVSTTFHTSERRIVLLGKTGDGKSSAGNTILGEKLFRVETSQHSITGHCTTQSKIINGRKITIVDTPGFFDTAATDEELKSEITKCIFDSAPGPHAFVIVLRVGRYTKQEEQIIKEIKELFSVNTFKYAVVLFTCGEELESKSITDYVKEKGASQGSGSERSTLKDLVDACHGRCHVIDNKRWNNQEEGESSNRTQLAKLFNTIEEMVQHNGGGNYTNELLMLVEAAIQEEMQHVREMQQGQGQQLSDREIREKAKETVRWRILVNKIVVTPAVLLIVLCNEHLIHFVPMKQIINEAATKKYPGEALKEALQKCENVKNTPK